MKLRERVDATLREHDMLSTGERVLVAVSGGVDSMTLLHLLRDLADDWELALGVAHLDHRMRPDSSDDARFVAHHARSLGLPVFQEAVDVPAHIERAGCSPEAGAREVRYRFLRDAALDLAASAVALGHTLDDRVETFFLNLLRGAGLDGLAGMPAVRTECDLRYVRPLMDVTRADVEAYAKTYAVPYREDPSNREPRYERNRVRHELMPLLETFNPSVRDAVGRAADALDDLASHLNAEADELLERALIESDEMGAAGDASVLGRAHRALLRQALRRAIVHVNADLNGITSEHLEALSDLVHAGRSGRSVALPHSLTGRYQADQLIIERGTDASSDVDPVAVSLNPDGPTDVPQLGWRLVVDEMRGSHPHPSGRLEARLDAATMVGQLSVRNRRPGDRIQPLGLGGTKKLQDILVDAKIPRRQRNNVPLVCDDRGILWVTGLCLDERARVTPDTQTTLRLRAERVSAEEAR